MPENENLAPYYLRLVREALDQADGLLTKAQGLMAQSGTGYPTAYYMKRIQKLKRSIQILNEELGNRLLN